VKLAKAKVLFLMVAMLLAGNVFAMSEAKKQAIAERIKPVGEVCIEGDSDCASASAAASTGPKEPADIYKTSCAGCHDTGAGGAPKVGDKAGWAARIAQGNDSLYSNAINGFNAMPAMGLCMSCSEDEVKATVDLMVKKSK
jgi:cytochrome c5